MELIVVLLSLVLVLLTGAFGLLVSHLQDPGPGRGKSRSPDTGRGV